MTKNNLLIIFSVIIILGCKKKTNNNLNNSLNGEYFYSEDKNISYFIPEGFTHFTSNNKSSDDKIISNLKNSKLKDILSRGYINGHVLPIAENFQYLYKEDSINYQNIFINEVKYMRLNDATAKVLSNMNRKLFNKLIKKSSAEINWEKDYIINKSDYQIIVNTGNVVLESDTTHWENYIVSKFNRTFTMTTKSNIKSNFLPYINKIQFGDKR